MVDLGGAGQMDLDHSVRVGWAAWRCTEGTGCCMAGWNALLG